MNNSCYTSVSQNFQLSTIRIYSFEDENPEGIFYNALYGGRKAFYNLISLMLMIEDCMNKISYPQQMFSYRKLGDGGNANHTKKTFIESDSISLPNTNIFSDWSEREPIATFSLRMVFRTIAGWQGEAECAESGCRKLFRSDMEFVLFIADELKKIID